MENLMTRRDELFDEYDSGLDAVDLPEPEPDSFEPLGVPDDEDENS